MPTGLILLIVLPLIVLGLCFGIFKIQPNRNHAILALALPIIGAVAFFSLRWGSMQGTEYLNTRVSKLGHAAQACCHTYECNCYCTGYDEYGDCDTEICDTCTEHVQDYKWWVEYYTGHKNVVRKCDPDPDNSPPQWRKARVGEPASIRNRYSDYRTLLPRVNVVDPEHSTWIPDYPSIKGLHRVDKVVSDRVRIPAGWNRGLQNINADYGSEKQVDVVLFFTAHPDREFAKSVSAKWRQGPKNALIIVAGVTEGVISWVEGVSMSAVPQGLQSLVGTSLSDPKWGLDIIEREVKQFERKPMATLRSALRYADLPIWQIWILLAVLSIGGCLLAFKL